MARPNVSFGLDQRATTLFNIRPGQLVFPALSLFLFWRLTFFGSTGWVGGLIQFMIIGAISFTRLPLPGGQSVYLDELLLSRASHAVKKKHGTRGELIPSWHMATGFTVEQPQQSPPAELPNVRLLSSANGMGREYGFSHDGHTLVGAIRLYGQPTNRLSGGQLEQALDSWHNIIAACSSLKQPLISFGWLTVSVASAGNTIADDLERRGVAKNDAVDDYRRLIAGAQSTVEEHETYIVLRQALDRSGRRRHQHLANSCTNMITALHSVANACTSAGMPVLDDGLSPGKLARLIRTIYRPFDREDLEDSVPLHAAWPGRTNADNYHYYTTSGVHHIVYEVEWPERIVAADFLRPLALEPSCARTLAVWFAPDDPQSADTRAESRRVSREANWGFLQNLGFARPRRSEKKEEADDSYHQQILAGAVPMTVSGWVSLAARNSAELELAARQAHDAAIASAVTLRRRDGEHAECFQYVLPFATGVAKKLI